MSERLYRLPFDTKKHKLNIMQGWHGPWSHMQLNPNMDLSFAVDFELPLNSEVRAARAGKVLWKYDASDWYYTGQDPKIGTNPPLHGGTNSLWILHEDGSAALYSHIRKGGIVVAKNQRVDAGQKLAYTGLSGWIGGTPHLHFQVNKPGGDFISEPFAFEDYSGPLEHNKLYPPELTP